MDVMEIRLKMRGARKGVSWVFLIKLFRIEYGKVVILKPSCWGVGCRVRYLYYDMTTNHDKPTWPYAPRINDDGGDERGRRGIRNCLTCSRQAAGDWFHQLGQTDAKGISCVNAVQSRGVCKQV